MSQPDSQLKGKVLNLIGNLCRHSSYFYKKLEEFGILAYSIKLCEDQDKTVKKFACVVLGNASFHDDSLYETLRSTIPILINLIKDSE
jgi:fused-like protein